MNAQLTKRLYRHYPKLFANRPWVDCGDGWYSIVDNTCRTLQRHVDATGKWQPRIVQIKEKWARLVVSLDGYTEFAHGVLEMAEAMSAYTCESCGKTGDDESTDMGITTGYATTVCDACRTKTLSPGWVTFKAMGKNHGEIIGRPKRRRRTGSRK